MLFNQIDQNIIIAVVGFLFFWLLVLSLVLLIMVRHYRRLVGKTKKQDLKKALEEILNMIERQDKTTEVLVNRLSTVERKNLKNLQKIGFLRFNPFSDTGGDQSFVLSFLDGEENGVVLSSLHSRGITRIYAKTVKKGKEDDGFQLSKEEKEAIKKAQRRRS